MTDPIPAWVDGQLVPVGKLEVHERGLRHPAVSVFVTDGHRVLIQRRALSKYHTPGLWANTCCTHPHWGEAAEACAHRRLAEELGIEGLDLSHRGRIEYRADVGQGMTEHEVVEVFVAATDGGVSMALNPDEVMDAIWIDLDVLAREAMRRPERFTPWLRVYLDDHRDVIFQAA